MDNKVPQHINDIVGDNVKKLAQLFPSVVKDGEVDFEALKEELGQFEEAGSEKYELTWAGKKNAKKIAQEDVIGRTLKFIPEDSKNADTTENLYIEGDNLEVLKMLRQNYYGAIKMIYIDPPYNTGSDFVYNDSFIMSQEEADVAEENIDILGERFTINRDSGNKFHANWLSMIYSRLKLARELLQDNGIIYVSYTHQ
ncbi:MAG: site-specific DNA-methyltransferase, partial [Lachnospiraceae bacterium]|nr:site-specific DNA-methyltransferase [Lachnospiraceae bacterium]